MGILTQIRRQPDNQKKFFSFLTAVILTLIIVGFWLSFNFNSAANEASAENQDKLSSISPLQLIKDEFSKAFAGFDTGGTSTVEVVPVDISSTSSLNDLATTTATSTDLSTSTATTTKENIKTTTSTKTR